ncbi:glycosyltransferase [Oerskovia sp. Sa1BUA8]|uniref:Glycosyltransferase n=1 Tax=Oerskovia douganii TaxID=2762210 RepID=A0A9D5YZ91_9CELL|nr:glycosyltransferase [Oerskovia douganii]MBE7701498.1 glycosyltransferase [Oerskovia douganii]
MAIYVAITSANDRRRDIREGRIESAVRRLAQAPAPAQSSARPKGDSATSAARGSTNGAAAQTPVPTATMNASRTEDPDDASQNRSNWPIERQIIPRIATPDDIEQSYANKAERAKDVRVAIICDEFTYNSFSPEFDAVALDPSSWREQMEKHQPEFLLCESAWAGVDPITRPWRGMIYGSVKFAYENRSVLFDILSYCKTMGIPTIFWNKEDPTHFGDRVNDFVDTASRFDHVFTTAEECIPDYMKFMGSGRVGLLPFAAQTQLFNPLPLHARRDQIIFAGAWYSIHEERSSAMRSMFNDVIKSGRSLAIYDRDSAVNSPDRRYPDEYARYIHPAVKHSLTADLYRRATIGMNVNTVTTSNSMFARRVFELAASGTMVVSNYSPGIERYFGDSVVFMDRDRDRFLQLNKEEIESNTLRGQETVLEAHTYAHRAQTILSALGRTVSMRPLPTLAARVSSLSDAEVMVGAYRRRAVEFHRMILIVDASVPTHRVGEFFTRFNDSMCSVVSARLATSQPIQPRTILETPDVLMVGTLIPSKEVIRRMMLHRAYCLKPIVSGNTSALRWGASAADQPILMSAADFLPMTMRPHLALPVLEVPSV